MPEIDRPQPSLRRWGSREGPLFGRYELGKLLGCGAFAKVYHARDVRTGLSVAIKIINKSRILSSSGLVCNVKREIAIMKKLHNPHIVKLHEVLASKTKIYFVMEFVKGGELFAKVSKGRLSESLSRKYFQQLISAVGYCHSRGVYHRDLKPENILIDENGVLKVSDFGLSAFTGQIHNDGLLHTLCGTPAYVAPEILAKRGYDGAKADIWSCGVILFVLTAGYLPFNESNLMMMYKKIYKGEYRCPKWMSADLKRFLSRILDTNPETRITVDEIIRDPWFTKGLTRQVKFYDEDYDPLKTGEEIKDTSPLNAFDLISFSSGLNLSGLFDESCISTADNTDRLVVGESPQKVIERCEEIVKGHEAVRIKKGKEWVLEFVGGQNGNMSLELEVYYLMESLVVVDVKSRGANGEGLYHDLWKQKIRPQLLGGGGRCREAEA